MPTTAWYQSPFGAFEIKGSALGICSVLLREPPQGIDFQSAGHLAEEHPVAACRRQLAEYFAGQREVFDLPFDWEDASDFYKMVWNALLKIPFGKTASYADIAARIGRPKAVRAVGLANRSNPIAIIVPCHRVIGKGGELRGYFYGLDTKMALLRHENPQRFAGQALLWI